jgi:hypothetical protein
MRSAITMSLFLAVTTMLFAGCFPGAGNYTSQEPAGFFTGVWHGWIAPVSLVVGLFKSGVRVYEPANTGWWYDFGFYIAVIAGFGSVTLSRKRKRDRAG